MNIDDQRPAEGETKPRRKGERHRAVPLAREVRYFAPADVEVRAASADSPEITISGAAIVYGASYRVVDMFGEFRETIHKGAATPLLARGVDCRLLLNHDGLPMARTASGTLDLIDSDDALRFVARLDARQQLASDFAVAIERGDLSQMSVGMIVATGDGDKWGRDGDTETRDIYRLADLLDISGVTYPCSPTTHIEVAQRMAFAMPLESRARLRQMEVELRAGKVLSADNQSKLVTALSALHDLADAGGVDPANLADDDDESSTRDDGTEGGSSAESDAGIVYPDGSGQRDVPATEAERRALSLSFGDQQSAVYTALCELLESYGGGESDIWICDIGPDWVVYQSYYGDGGYYRLAYTLGEDDAVSFDGDPVPVRRVTSYVATGGEDDAGDTEPGAVTDADAEMREDDPSAPAPAMTASTLRLMVEAKRTRPSGA